MTYSLPLKQRNLPDRLADHLVNMIAKGELKPGQRLFEKEICEGQRVSRIPVREALRLLQAQGIVRTEPNRGTFVTGFTSDEMSQLLELRLGVERIALRTILGRGTPKPDITSQFADVLEDMRRAAKLDDQLAYCQADLSFHNRIVDLSFSPVLSPVWQLLSRGVLVFLMQEHDSAFDYDQSIREHERLLALIQMGKKIALEQERERHILGKMTLHRSLREQPAEQEDLSEALPSKDARG